MPYQFDANHYKNLFDQMYGKGQFDAGISQAQRIGRSNAQVSLAKQTYNQRHTSSGVTKKSYQDAVDYVSQNKDKFLNPDLNGGKSGAYQIANEIRNDPAKQAEIKAQGYNVSDYINALYAGLSDGNVRSEREYKQHTSQMKKDLKANPYVSSELRPKNQPKNKHTGLLDNIGGLFKDLGHDVSQKASGAGHELSNIWKAVSDGPGGYKLSDVANDTQKNMKKDLATNAKRGYSSNLSKEVHRGANRAMDGASLGVLSDYRNKANQNGYNWNTDFANNRPVGKGGVTDFLTSGLGYLAPGSLAYKGAKAFKVGDKTINALTKLGASPKIAKLGGLGTEGAVAGGLFGAQQNFADSNMTLKQGVQNIGLNTALGAVADPLFHVAGSRIAKFFGKDKVVKSELDSALSNPNTPNDVKKEILALPQPKVAGYLNEGQKQLPPPMRLNEPMMINSGTNAENTIPIYRRGRKSGNWWSENADYVKSGFSGTRPFQESQLSNDSKILDLTNDMTPLESLMTKDELNTFNNDFNQNTRRELYKKVLKRNGYDGFKYLDQGEDGKAHTTYFLASPSKIDSKQLTPLQYVGKGSMPNLKVQQVPPEIPPLNFSKKLAVDKNLVNPLQTKLNPKKEVAATVEKAKKQPEYINASSDPGLVKASTKDAELEKILSNSDNWKDKGNLSYGRETMDRNFEDVMGKDAPKMKKVFLDPIKTNETNRVKFLNKERQQVKSYGIKPKSQDDKLVQMYGEGKITLDELKQQTPSWKKVVKVANAYRAKYDELLNTVNKVLEANGYDPIPKRANYFPHYEEIDNMLSKLGFDMNNNMLPTDINGLTDSFKPGKSFFRNALQRKGDKTTFGAIEGFDKYIEGISNVIYHTKDIKNIRSLEKAIRNKYEGDTHLSNFVTQLDEYGNVLAGKKSKIDRAAEFVMGRKVYNALDTIRRRTGANIIGANVSSALTNFIPFTHSLATTDKKAFAKAMLDTLTNVVRKDGIVHDSGFLTRRIGSDPLYRNLWDKTVDKTMWLMKTVDNFTSQVIVRSKYYEGLKKGLSPEQAMKQADDWTSKIMADRSKGQMPPWFNSKTLGVLSQFQLEVNNQLSFMLKDIPRNMDKKAMASAFGQIVLYSYLFNNVYEKMMGRRPAFDPLGVALQAYKDYNNDNITKSKASVNLFENVANQLPFTSALTGGRYPISAGLPSVPNLIDAAKQGQFSQQLKKEMVKPLFDLLPPAGGNQVKKTYEGLSALSKGGEYLGNKMKYPISNTPGNELRGALFGKYAFPEANQYYNDNRRILDPKQTKRVENSSNPKQTYEQIQFNRRETTLVNQIKKVLNSNESQKVKGQKLNELQKRLQKLQGGR